MTAKHAPSAFRPAARRHTLLGLTLASLFALPLAGHADDAAAQPTPQPLPPNPFIDALRNAAEQARRRPIQPVPTQATPAPAQAAPAQPAGMALPMMPQPPAATPVAAKAPPSTTPPATAATNAKPAITAPAPVATPATATAEASAQTAGNRTPIAPRKDVLIEQPKLDPAAGVTLRFDNAEIFEVVQTVMGDILHLNYVVDPGVTGKVNINGLSPVSSEDLLGVLQSVLAFNNVSIIRDGNVYKVVRDAMVPRDSVSGAAPGNNGALVQIFAPRYIQPSAALNTLKAFIGPQAAITNDPTDHYLIVVDRAANMKKLQELLQSLDVDYLSAVQTEVVQIENGDATEVAKEMETLFKTSQLYNWKGTEANKVFFMPIKRMNAILVAAANKDVLDAAKRRIHDVDVAPKEGLNARINIYTVKNSSAGYLAGLVSQIYGGSAPSVSSVSSLSSAKLTSPSSSTTGSSTGTTAASAPSKVVEKGPSSSTTASGAGLSGEVQIIPNEKNNSLIIKAGRQDYLQILKLLEQLDTVSRQVLIEANIIEVTLGKENEMGIQWTLAHEKFNYDGRSYGAVAQKTGSPSYSSTTAGQGLVYTIGSLSNIIAQIEAVAGDTDINVLSSPRVIASDGKEAKIEIGDDVAVPNGSTSTASSTVGGTPITTYTYEYRTVGLLLHVKPSINESGLVDLEISQEVSTLTNPTAVYPVISRRSVDTEVTLQEGKTVVIGGLIQNSDSQSNVGVPWLKDVPILGALFRNTGKNHQRTELLLTLTPHIIRSPDDSEHASADIDNAMAELRKFKHGPSLPTKVTTQQ